MEKYVEALAVIDAINKQRTETPNAPCGWVCDMLNARIATMRPADVRPVVLCGKCRLFDDTGYPNPDPEMPELRMGYCLFLGREVQACWFCGTGEQKEDEDG